MLHAAKLQILFALPYCIYDLKQPDATVARPYAML